MQAFHILYEIIAMITNVLVMLIIVQFIIGLLFAFNVIDRSNQFLMSFYEAINRLLDPMYRPIRKILPDTGSIDFSPAVVLIVLSILTNIVLPSLARNLIASGAA